MLLTRVATFTTAALLAAALAGPAFAQPQGGFIAVLDDDRNNGNSSNTVLYYDVTDMSTPMFAIFAGWKSTNTVLDFGVESTTGGSRSLGSLSVNPYTGETYVLEVDRDGPIGSDPGPGGVAPGLVGSRDDIFKVPANSEGDYNILTFDFKTAYNDWVTNQGGAYVTYVDGTLGDPLAPAPLPGEVDLRIDHIQTYNAGPPNLNEVFLPDLVSKVGEVARPEHNDFTPNGFHPYIDTYIEYVNDDTVVLLDRPNAPLSNAAEIAAMTQLEDPTVRVLNRSSTSAGGSAAYVPGSTEGGFDRGTTETWESIIIGQPLSDTSTPGEYVDVALVRNKDGVTGLWITENDQPAGTGDEVSFFEITNFSGPVGNGLRQFNVGAGTTNFILDNDPTTPAGALLNDGDTHHIHVNPITGDLFVIESGFFDSGDDGIDQDLDTFTADEERGLTAFGAHEPSVIIRQVDTYDNGLGQIDFGAWSIVKLDFSGPDGLAGTADDIPDDDGFIVDSRRTVYDHVNNVMYFYDFDAVGTGFYGDSNGGSFVFDWYGLDLDTGAVTTALLDVDESTRGFGTEDHFEFFSLLAGDYNQDGFVGIEDLNIILGNWNQNVTTGFVDGDGTGDGFVGIEDLNEVLGNWNAGTPPPPGSVVPEPASLALFTIAGLTTLARRRSRA